MKRRKNYVCIDVCWFLSVRARVLSYLWLAKRFDPKGPSSVAKGYKTVQLVCCVLLSLCWMVVVCAHIYIHTVTTVNYCVWHSLFLLILIFCWILFYYVFTFKHIGLCFRGFKLHSNWLATVSLCAHTCLQEGDTLTNHKLTQTLLAMRNGIDPFYTGDIAKSIVEEVSSFAYAPSTFIGRSLGLLCNFQLGGTVLLNYILINLGQWAHMYTWSNPCSTNYTLQNMGELMGS